MSAKMIFYKDTMKFCPIKNGCKNCFLPAGCNGVDDTNVAFNLYERRGIFWMRPYKPVTLDKRG